MNSKSLFLAAVAIVVLFVGAATAATAVWTVEQNPCLSGIEATTISCDVIVTVKENGTDVPLKGIRVTIGIEEKYTDENGVVIFVVARGNFIVLVDGKERGYDSINISSCCHECGNLVRIDPRLDPRPVLIPPPAEVPAFSGPGIMVLAFFMCVVGVATIRNGKTKK